MQYSELGRTGVKVSKIVLGTATFGVSPRGEEAENLVSSALDLGINMFDTADSYGVGERFDRAGGPPAAERPPAEAVLGEALKGRRQDVMIATKASEPVGDGPNDRGLSRLHLIKQLEESLKRLQTDYVDLYYAHHDDPNTPLEETLDVYDEMVRAGKVRYYALSNYSSWRLTEALWYSDRRKYRAPACIQNAYSLANRAPEREVLPACRHFGVGFLAFSPLANGLLSGAEILSRPIVGSQRWGGRGYTQEQTELALHWDELAKAAGRQPAQLAIGWLLAQPGVSGSIIGSERVESLRVSCEAADIEVPAELVKEINTSIPA